MPPSKESAVLLFGMSRSGTSLATSLVASLLGDRSPAVWRGSGPSYPTDNRNRLGYFERHDLVRLNYDVLRSLSGSWTHFPPGFAQQPAALNFSDAGVASGAAAAAAHPRGLLDLLRSASGGGSSSSSRSSSSSSSGRSRGGIARGSAGGGSAGGATSARASRRAAFEARAEPIVADMARRGVPFVLKDVRFARTLPLWAPLLRAHTRRLACVIPFRHPAEVERSSITGGDRILLWRHYLLAALGALHTAAACPCACPCASSLYPATRAQRRPPPHQRDSPARGASRAHAASARAVCGPTHTLLLDYNAWFAGEARRTAQLRALHDFLRCAGIAGAARGASSPVADALNLIRDSEKHFEANASRAAAANAAAASAAGRLAPPRPLPAAAACLLDELRSGRAARWPHWDAQSQRFASVPCGP